MTPSAVVPNEDIHDREPIFVVTLVHGTFGREAGWIEPDSALSKYLAAYLAGPLRIAPFRWSGRNSVGARLRAGVYLRRQLKRTIQSYPGAFHYVVGHSHGGNVILHALHNSAIAAQLRGAVMLSTPFLYFRPRNPWLIRNFLRVAALLLPALTTVALAIATDTKASATWAYFTLSSALLYAGFMRYVPAIQGNALRTMKRLTPPILTPLPVLVIRRPGDEASGILTSASFLTWLLERVWKLGPWLTWQLFDKTFFGLAFAWNKVERHGRWLFTGALLSLSVALFWSEPYSSVATSVLWVFLLILMMPVLVLPLGLLTFVLVPLLTAALALPTVLVSSLFSGVFGTEFLWLSLFSEVAVDSCPPGSCTLVQLPLDEKTSDVYKLDLNQAHGSAYEDPSAFRVLAEFMNSTSS